MMRNIVIFVFASVVVSIGQSAIIDMLLKCPVEDTECHGKNIHNMLSKIGETGIPEMDIPPIDPIHLKNIYVSILNLFNLTLVDGVAKGIKDCVFEEFTNNFKKGNGKQIIVCDIEIKGHYKLSGASPIFESVLGGSEIQGEGNAEVNIDKIRIEFVYPFTVQRRDDGEIYVKSESQEKIQKKFDVMGKVTFNVDNIFIGKEDVSEQVVKYLNENWKSVMKSFGQIFYDKAADLYFNFSGKFFDSVPAKNYISDDLTPYLKN